MQSGNSLSTRTDDRFDVEFSDEQMAALCEAVLQLALHNGASHASVSFDEAASRTISVRDAQLTEQTAHSSSRVSIVTYIDTKEGRASSADLSASGLLTMVQAACAAARHAMPDPCAGLARTTPSTRVADRFTNLSLSHVWDASAPAFIEIATRIEHAAIASSPRIRQAEGTTLRSTQTQSWRANTLGFSDGYRSSMHSASCIVLAADDSGKQRSAWSLTRRDPADFGAFDDIGTEAAKRAVSRLGGSTISSRRCSVVFDSMSATGLLASFVQAASGTALYRRLSWLEGKLQQRIIAPHLSISEDPFLPKGLRSAPFDSEGIIGQNRDVVRDGVLEGYFLSAYSARRLELPATGNADGVHNLSLNSQITIAGGLPALLKKMGRGLLITGLLGESLNVLTGDYSRGAYGFWIEDGECAHPVERITITGNLWTMLNDVIAIGDDRADHGGLISGSVLISEMAVSGQ